MKAGRYAVSRRGRIRIPDFNVGTAIYPINTFSGMMGLVSLPCIRGWLP